MGLGYEIPANQLGGLKILRVFAGYRLSQVWVKTGSTVVREWELKNNRWGDLDANVNR